MRRSSFVARLIGAVTLTVAVTGPARAGIVINVPTGGALDYGNVLVGTTATGTVTARNTGTTAAITFGNPVASPPFARQGAAAQTGVAANGTASRSYSYAPTQRGSATTSTSATITSSNGGSATLTLKGKGVAPVNSVTHADAGPTRIGTQGHASVTIKNLGDGNTTAAGTGVGDLKGTVQGPAGSPAFAGPAGVPVALHDGGSQVLNYTYTPAGHSTDTTSVVAQFTDGSGDGKNAAQSVPVTLNGQGVGPDYQSIAAPGSVLDFGTIHDSEESHLALSVTNASADPNGGVASLTGLTLLSATITGADAASFALAGFTAGMVLDEGTLDIFDLAFVPVGRDGFKSAILTIVTDQGAGFGSAGQSFRYDLQGIVAPEPSTLISGSLAGLIGLGYARRKRRAKAAA